MIVHSRFLYVLLLRTYCYLLTSLFLLRHLTYTAAAVKCLQNAEKRKFTRLGGGTVTADTITREEVLRTLQASNDLLQIWANCPHGSMGPTMHGSSSMTIRTIQSNSALHTQRLPTCPASQVFTQVSQVAICGSARDSPTRSSMGTPTQLPRTPLSFSSNSDLLARRHLLFTTGANPAMSHVPSPQFY